MNLPALECRDDVRVILEHGSQHRVNASPIRLEIDQERNLRTPAINAPAVFPGALAQGFEVKGLQRSLRFYLGEVVRHQQLALDQVNVCFNAAKALIQCIEER